MERQQVSLVSSRLLCCLDPLLDSHYLAFSVRLRSFLNADTVNRVICRWLYHSFRKRFVAVCLSWYAANGWWKVQTCHHFVLVTKSQYQLLWRTSHLCIILHFGQPSHCVTVTGFDTGPLLDAINESQRVADEEVRCRLVEL